jgi:hypothetical protein
VKIDRDALARFNLDLAEVQAYIETAMGGHVASEFWDGEKRFDGDIDGAKIDAPCAPDGGQQALSRKGLAVVQH